MGDVTQSIPDSQNTLPRKWRDMGDGTWAEVVAAVAISPASGEKTGINSNSSVGNASATIIPAGTYADWVTIQNTHATQGLSVSFNNPALPTDFTLAPGSALTLPFGLSNTLYGIGSGAGTTYALIGA